MTVTPKYVGGGLYKVQNHMNYEFMFIKEIQIDSKDGSIGYEVCFSTIFHGAGGYLRCAHPDFIVYSKNYSPNTGLIWIQAIDTREEFIRNEMELNRMDLEFIELAETLEQYRRN